MNQSDKDPPRNKIVTTEELCLFIAHSNAIEDEPFEVDDESLDAFELLVEHSEMTPDAIRNAHSLLMRKKNIPAKYRGQFRDCPIWIGGEKRENQFSIPNDILQWCSLVNKSKFLTLDNHIRFEKIHPFFDGNGRIGRLLWLWELQRGGHRFRYFDESKRSQYYRIFSGKKYDEKWFLR